MTLKVVASLLDEAVRICLRAQEKSGKDLNDFLKFIGSDETVKADIATLRTKVRSFASKFPMPGL